MASLYKPCKLLKAGPSQYFLPITGCLLFAPRWRYRRNNLCQTPLYWSWLHGVVGGRCMQIMTCMTDCFDLFDHLFVLMIQQLHRAYVQPLSFQARTCFSLSLSHLVCLKISVWILFLPLVSYCSSVCLSVEQPFTYKHRTLIELVASRLRKRRGLYLNHGVKKSISKRRWSTQGQVDFQCSIYSKCIQPVSPLHDLTHMFTDGY